MTILPGTQEELEALATRMNEILAAGRRAKITPTPEGTMGLYMLAMQMLLEYSAIPLDNKTMRELLEGCYDLTVHGLQNVPPAQGPS